MKNQKIGVVKIIYSQSGEKISTTFTPSEEFNDITLEDLSLQGCETEEDLVNNSNRIFANWFNKVDDVQLFDRKEGELVTEVITCDKWDNGKHKLVEVEYSYRNR